MDHIEEVERICSKHDLQVSETIQQCLKSAERVGMYVMNAMCIKHVTEDNVVVELVNNEAGCHMEEIW